MKRSSIVALAAGAMVLSLAGCGSGKSTPADGVRQATSTTAAKTASTANSAPVLPTTAAATTSAAPLIEPPAAAPVTASVAQQTTAPNGAQTDCHDFLQLTEDTEKQVIGQILAANPGSKFDGSPNVALGTARLACTVADYAKSPVAVAIGAAK
ncbi:hypothetical protein ACIP5Y_44955 [Nocardia sp. NPDC088792]|uniref:hypothetical protein n=1 Tax=Nocardia sp. NPDC088792 TaxID=3364332 RepID=UPI00380CD6BE